MLLMSSLPPSWETFVRTVYNASIVAVKYSEVASAIRTNAAWRKLFAKDFIQKGTHRQYADWRSLFMDSSKPLMLGIQRLRCRGFPRVCIEMGQDHVRLEPRRVDAGRPFFAGDEGTLGLRCGPSCFLSRAMRPNERERERERERLAQPSYTETKEKKKYLMLESTYEQVNICVWIYIYIQER